MDLIPPRVDRQHRRWFSRLIITAAVAMLLSPGISHAESPDGVHDLPASTETSQSATDPVVTTDGSSSGLMAPDGTRIG